MIYFRVFFDLILVSANFILIVYRSRVYEADRHLFTVGPGVGVHTFGRVNILDAILLLNLGLLCLFSRKLVGISYVARLIGGKIPWSSRFFIGLLLLVLSLASFLTR